MTKKPFISIIIVLAMVLTSLSSAFAESNQGMSEQEFNKHNEHILQKQEEVLSMLDKLASYRLQTLQKRDVSGLRIQDNTEIGELESRLNDLGVKKLTPSEVQTFIQSNKSGPIVPSNLLSSNVDWRSYEWTDVYNNGKYYTVRQLFAFDTGVGSPLYQKAEDLVIWQNRTVTLWDWSNYWAQVYAIKGLGFVPWLQWMPYELLVSPIDTSLTASAQKVDVYAHSTICFTYVTEQNSWSTEYKAHVSNSVKSSFTFRTFLTQPGSTWVDSKSINDQTVAGDNYALIYYAIQSYESRGAGNFEESFVNYLRFYGYDGVSSASLGIYTPNDPIYLM